MTTEEFYQKSADITIEAAEKEKSLRMQFVKENSPAKVGDIVRGDAYDIKVEEIRVHRRSKCPTLPCAVYIGFICNTDGMPRKESELYLHQDQLEWVNGKRVINHGYGEK